jgi:hypothetical protein
MTPSLLSRISTDRRSVKMAKAHPRSRARRIVRALVGSRVSLAASRNDFFWPKVAPAVWSKVNGQAIYELDPIVNLRGTLGALSWPDRDEHRILVSLIHACAPYQAGYRHEAIRRFKADLADERLGERRTVDDFDEILNLALSPSTDGSPIDWQALCYDYVVDFRRACEESEAIFAGLQGGHVESRILQEFAPGRWNSMASSGPSSSFILGAGPGDCDANGIYRESLPYSYLDLLRGHLHDPSSGRHLFLFPSNEVWMRAGRGVLGVWAEKDEVWFASRLAEIEECTAVGKTDDEWLEILSLDPLEVFALREERNAVDSIEFHPSFQSLCINLALPLINSGSNLVALATAGF